MRHVWLRGSTFWFSLRVPRRFVPVYGVTPIRVRIGKVDAIEARRRARVMAAHSDLGMDAGMQRDVLMRSLTALSAELDMLRRDWMSAGMKMLNAREIAAEAIKDHDAEMAERWSHAAAVQKGRVSEIDNIRKRLASLGTALDSDGIAWEAERRTYERTVAAVTVAAAEAKAALLAAVPAPPVPASEDPDASPESDITRDTLLSVAATPIVNSRCVALSAGGKNRYADHVRHSLACFLEIVGDKPLRKYLPSDLQDYANAMANVPLNLVKLREFRGMTRQEAAEANARLKQPKPCMKTATIDKYVTEVRHIWQRATASVADIRDIGAISVTMPRNAAPSLDREGLPAADLTTWFAAAVKRREPHYRWLPLLGLITGMRLSEIVYLKPGDIVDFEGHQVFDLRRFMTSGRPLKTKTSRRVVPVHPLLHETGFMVWVRDNRHKPWLFPAFHEADDPADAAQKRMGYWMQNLGVHTPSVGTFHSLRHNAKSWLRIAASERIADLMQGHAPRTVGGRYGFRLLQEEEIAKVIAASPPRSVDFSPYLRKR